LTKLSILLLNAQSIVRKLDELAYTVNDLKPDLILVTESWCNEETTNGLLTVPGYNMIPDLRLDRQDTAQGVGGGLLVFAKPEINILPEEQRYDFTQHVNFKVLTSGDEIQFTLVYRPPRTNQAAYDSLAGLIKSTRGNRILIGDFNLPGIDWEGGLARGAGPEKVLEACRDEYLEQMVHFPTHTRGNCLDLLLTNVPERVENVRSVGRLGSSDHFMIQAEILVGKHKEQQQGFVKNWWKADWSKMKEEMAAIDWSSLEDLTADEGWTFFKNSIDQVVERNVPLKPRGASGRPPWMSREILREVRKKRRLWAKTRNNNSDEYKRVEKKVRNLIRNAKRKLERKLALENGGNSKPFYAYLKSKLKNKSPVGPLKDKNGRVVSDNAEMAKILNGFFSSVFTEEGDGPVPEAEQCAVESKLEDVKVEEKVVRQKIKELKPASAAGPDGIGSLLLKELIDQVAKPLTKIYNKSISTGVVPGDWKDAHVTPIYKKGLKSDPSNYRPVSLTSICCKMLESVIRDEVVLHMTRNGLIEDSQHGFVKTRSCATNLIEFLDYLTEAAERGEATDAIFLDFAKAFDKVPRRRLLEKLAGIGVGGNILGWIEKWLSGRRQRVVLNGAASDWEPVKSGVPQGSVLGPILFLIFIRDIDTAAGAEALVKKFADDTKVARKVQNDQDAAKLQQVLDNMTEWAAKWKMEFNTGKCKVMHFGASNIKAEYTMAGQLLEVTKEERDIGVLVTDDLKPSAQCAKAAKTATTVLGQILRSFRYRDKNIFKALYLRYVRPHLEFSSPAWSPWLQKDVQVLEKVQKRAVRMINGLNADTYEGKLRELGIQSLADRRKEADMVLTYKVLHEKCSVNRDLWPKLINEHGRNAPHLTRSATDELRLRQPLARNDRRKNFFTVRACEEWNKLPPNVKKAKSIGQFKKLYKIFAASNPSEAMDDARDAM
jgi:Reverse transcriptase (RNA-dependent DNA polymerase)/Endonuclease-reverse transcriptase